MTCVRYFEVMSAVLFADFMLDGHMLTEQWYGKYKKTLQISLKKADQSALIVKPIYRPVALWILSRHSELVETTNILLKTCAIAQLVDPWPKLLTYMITLRFLQKTYFILSILVILSSSHIYIHTTSEYFQVTGECFPKY